MESSRYSTIVVNPHQETVQRIASIASALGEAVTVVDSKEQFLAVYSPSVRCIVLEVSTPNFCGVDVIRHLGDTNCQAALVLTTDSSPDLLNLAWKLATALGIVVADVLLKPLDGDRLQQALIAATDPAVLAKLRAHQAALPAAGREPKDYGDSCKCG